MPATFSHGPLTGRLILDCSSLLPGPRIGKLLAQKGARVIKMESPSKPDRAKTMGPFYEDLNSLKEILELEFKPEIDGKPNPEREKFEDLVRQADGLIEGFRPSTKAKLGLEANVLHKINPKLCIVSLTGYSENGPWRDRAGHDLNFGAVTGMLSLFQEMPGLPLADLIGAQEGAFAMATALDAVARGAPGTRIEVSLCDTLKKAQSSAIAVYRANGEIPRPGENLFSGKYPCYRIYIAKCGRRITVGAIEEKFWRKVCQIAGTPELADRGYSEGPDGAETIDRLQQALGARTWMHWAPLFDAADCCVEPVLDYSEVYPRGV